MRRRTFITVLGATTIHGSGCLGRREGQTTHDRDQQTTTPERVTVELRVVPSGMTDYSGTISVTDTETDSVVISDSFSYSMTTETPDDDNVQKGVAAGGGFYHRTVTRGTEYRVDVSLSTGPSDTYTWTVDDPLALEIHTTPDRIEFTETEKMMD